MEVSGSTVSRATLNNFSYMIEQNMKVCDMKGDAKKKRREENEAKG